MKKEDIYKQIKEKITITDDELDKIYKDIEKQFKSRNVKPVEQQILNRILAYLTPSLRSPAEKYTGIFLGIEDNFGFNQIVDKVKFDSFKLLKEDETSAKDMEVVDKENNPLWHYVDDVNVASFKIGRKIIEDDYSATCYILVDLNNKKVLKNLQIRGERRLNTLENMNNFIGKSVNFMANDKEGNIMNESKYTKFTVTDEQPKEELGKIIIKNVKDHCVDLSKLDDFYNKNIKNIKSMPVFIKSTVSKLFVSETNDNNIITLVDSNYSNNFSVFINKKLDMPQEGMTDVIFGGRLRKSDKPEQPYSMNAFMWYVPEEFKDMPIPDSVKKFMNQEEVVSDTSKNLEAMKKTSDDDW